MIRFEYIDQLFEAPQTSEKLEHILSTLRNELENLLGDQLEAVYLYGSQARGDTRPVSDIDILIVLKPAYYCILERAPNR